MRRARTPIAPLFSLALALFAVSAAPAPRATAHSQKPAAAAAHVARAGKYAVTLRLPDGGIYAEEETEIEFRIVDASVDDPVLGPPGVLRAAVTATVSMPAMPGMPKHVETAHAESVPGDYGVHPVFPHGGAYLLSLDVTPPVGERFVVEFPLAVADADPNRPPRPKPFSVELGAKPKRPRAGEPVDLRFAVRSRENPDEIVRDFDVLHEKLLHLMIVRSDLGVFFHEHPVQEKDGTFTLRHTFPTEGTYHLFCDLAPRGRGGQVLLAKLEVAPAKRATPATPFALASAPEARERTVDGVRVTLSAEPRASVARHDSKWSLSLTDAASGAPVTDLAPYLGAMGHLVLIHEDGVTYVHSHPADASVASAPKNAVEFAVRFPKPGRYRAWAQFNRGGKIVTADFVASVAEAR